MKKYLQIFKNHLSTAFTYRANLVTLLMFNVIDVVAVLLLWTFVFQQQGEIKGFNFNDVLLYYLLTPFIGTLTMVEVSDILGNDIKDGKLSMELIKPYKIWISRFIEAIASKLHLLLIIVPIYALILFLYFLFNPQQSINAGTVILSFLFAFLAFLMHFFLDLALGYSAFWVDDVWAFKHVKEIFFGLFGGQTFPFEFLSQSLRNLFEFLPFKFFYYVPVAYFLGKRDLSYIQNDILMIILWSFIFILASLFFWKLGLKRYEAFGN